MDTAAVFTITIVFLAGLTVNHAYPAAQDWPEECKGKSYCHIRPDYYPTEKFTKLFEGMKLEFEQSSEIGNRSSVIDVAHKTVERDAYFNIVTLVTNCARSDWLPPLAADPFGKLYLILDESNTIRFVPQNNDTFSFTVEIEECRSPGRSFNSSLDEEKLKEQRVDCYETKLPIMFPVLSVDGTKLESVAPKGGLPLSCSAKVMDT